MERYAIVPFRSRLNRQMANKSTERLCSHLNTKQNWYAILPFPSEQPICPFQKLERRRNGTITLPCELGHNCTDDRMGIFNTFMAVSWQSKQSFKAGFHFCEFGRASHAVRSKAVARVISTWSHNSATSDHRRMGVGHPIHLPLATPLPTGESCPLALICLRHA